MNNVKCCIIGCKSNNILCVCKTCKFYFCYDHRQVIDSHEIVPSFSVYDNYYCCNLCFCIHYYIECPICEDMVINTMTIIKNGNRICRYPCFKYKNNI